MEWYGVIWYGVVWCGVVCVIKSGISPSNPGGPIQADAGPSHPAERVGGCGVVGWDGWVCRHDEWFRWVGMGGGCGIGNVGEDGVGGGGMGCVGECGERWDGGSRGGKACQLPRPGVGGWYAMMSGSCGIAREGRLYAGVPTRPSTPRKGDIDRV